MPKRWRRQPNERGLARVCQSPRGYELHENGKQLAYVSPVTRGLTREVTGWYFVCLGPAHHNSLWENVAYPTADEAKGAALAHIKQATTPTPETPK